MKKFIYLAGPITGLEEEEAKDWREMIKERLSENIKAISPLRCEPDVGETYRSEYDDPNQCHR